MEWNISTALVPYEQATAFMEARVQAIHEGTADEMVWLLEHPPLYTAGTGAQTGDLLHARFPVHTTGRGGQYTYHGPGQRIVYVMLNLNRRGRDVRLYVQNLEAWLIATLADFGVTGEIREGRVGVWVPLAEPVNSEAKIAAIGVRLRKWVTYHGMALNVSPDLTHYNGIIPCGVRAHGVTSLAALGKHPSMPEVDAQLRGNFATIFRPPLDVGGI